MSDYSKGKTLTTDKIPVTEQEIDDLIVHLNIHYGDDTPLTTEDGDLLIEALESYKEKIKEKNG